jgi:hypothetical protein
VKSAALVLAALVVSGAAGAVGAGDPRTMVLRPRDMPADFRQTKARYVSNVQASREAAVRKDLGRLGRQRGYEVTYEKRAPRGTLLVVSRASTYRTPAGARESMERDVRATATTRRLRFRRVPLAATIGDESHLYRATVKQAATTVDVYTITWRSGRVYAAVIASALAGTGKPWFVVTLARRQQARIEPRP